ncbi:MAG: sigma-54-dependent Fis family transcriptional regulator [Spirochaetales bacterium]|nr:sigma-54-dependent Fis family transcriptional regulator [Spirochaetales bacterium]
MSLFVLSLDWRTKERFKLQFTQPYLRLFNLPDALFEALGSETPDMIVIDSKEPKIAAGEIIRRLGESRCSAPVIVFTRDEPLRNFRTPYGLKIRLVHKRTVDWEEVFKEICRVGKTELVRDSCPIWSSGLVGESASMVELRKRLEFYATKDCPVHIYGETGTGKELAAEYLHRRRHPQRHIIAINCSLLNDAVGKSVFFGHSKGAFTDATNELIGLLCQANNSSLFLDEVENLPMVFQAHMLRLLENGKYRRLGDTKIRSSDFRLITASNEKLVKLVSNGRMRKDFFYRITDVQIHMPPLREHSEDIPLLIRHFFSTISERRPVSDRSIRRLQEYHWPGNVRQLFSVLRRASIHARGDRWIEIDEKEFIDGP